MFEVFENEGWDGHLPQWYATNGETPSVTFDSEEEAQEYCDEMNEDAMNTLDLDNLQFSIDSKFVGNRDGSCSRSAEELAEVFIGDACALLKLEEPIIIKEVQEFIHDIAMDYEGMLSDKGYDVVWNDGFAIYKDLTEEEAAYLYEG